MCPGYSRIETTLFNPIPYPRPCRASFFSISNILVPSEKYAQGLGDHESVKDISSKVFALYNAKTRHFCEGSSVDALAQFRRRPHRVLQRGCYRMLLRIKLKVI